MDNSSISTVHFGAEKNSLLDASLKIRREVFIMEQSVPEDIELDGLEHLCRHFLLYYRGFASATARLRKTSKGYKIERFAVLKPMRSFQLGRALLKAMIAYHRELHQALLYLHAQYQVIGFYEKYGFVATGDIFYEAGIPHREMVFKGF